MQSHDSCCMIVFVSSAVCFPAQVCGRRVWSKRSSKVNMSWSLIFLFVCKRGTGFSLCIAHLLKTFDWSTHTV